MIYLSMNLGFGLKEDSLSLPRAVINNRSPQVALNQILATSPIDAKRFATKDFASHTTMKFILAVLAITGVAQAAEEKDDLAHIVTLGPRPYYLVDEMIDGALKEKLGESI